MVFFFSATGNTRWCAERLAEATQERLTDMAEAVIEQRFAYDLQPEERLAFVFPVHGWQLPRLVVEFIQRLNIGQVKPRYVYAMCTAGDNIGLTMDILKQLLSERQLALHSTFSLIMPESYVGLPFMDVDTPLKEAEKIAQSASRLESWLPRIIACEEDIHEEVRGKWPRLNTRVLGRFFHHHLISDKKFHLRHEDCKRCGRCVEVCPTHNMLQTDNGTPQWMHSERCLTCFACYHHCPTHAREFGRQTKKKGQYYYGKNNKR